MDLFIHTNSKQNLCNFIRLWITVNINFCIKLQKSSTKIEKSRTKIQKSSTKIQKSSTEIQKSSTKIQKFSSVMIRPIQSITITDINLSRSIICSFCLSVYKRLSLSPVLCFINPINVLSLICIYISQSMEECDLSTSSFVEIHLFRVFLF